MEEEIAEETSFINDPDVKVINFICDVSPKNFTFEESTIIGAFRVGKSDDRSVPRILPTECNLTIRTLIQKLKESGRIHDTFLAFNHNKTFIYIIVYLDVFCTAYDEGALAIRGLELDVLCGRLQECMMTKTFVAIENNIVHTDLNSEEAWTHFTNELTDIHIRRFTKHII